MFSVSLSSRYVFLVKIGLPTIASIDPSITLFRNGKNGEARDSDIEQIKKSILQIKTFCYKYEISES